MFLSYKALFKGWTVIDIRMWLIGYIFSALFAKYIHWDQFSND